MHKKSNDLDKWSEMKFARYCQSELRIDQKFFTRLVLDDKREFFVFWICEQARSSGTGFGTFKWDLSSVKERTLCYGLFTPIKIEVTGPHLFENKNLREKTYNPFSVLCVS